MAFLPLFDSFPNEAALIGRLVAGYGCLETDLMLCVLVAKRDTDPVIKTMFRPRGETQRLDIADALGRPSFKKFKRETEFGMAIGAISHCLKIRNQYAHSNFGETKNGKLAFASMEDIAKSHDPSDFSSITLLNIDEALLHEQLAYFEYAEAWLHFLIAEVEVSRKNPKARLFSRPKALVPLPLHIS
jgi:hypothetical protein